MQRYFAVLVLVAWGAVACTPTRQMIAPTAPDAQSHPHRIGILGLPPLQLTYAEPPAPGAGAGYKRGVGECFNGAGHSMRSPLVFAAAVTLCPTVGGTVGAALNVSATEVAEAQTALARIGREHPFGDGLRGELAHQLVQAARPYAVALLAPDGTDPLGAPADRVVVLTNPTVTLLSYRRSKIRTDGAPLTLYVSVDAELRRAGTNAVVHRDRIECWGERFSFMDWGAADGERLALGLARAQRSLAEHLAQHFFQVQTPTATKRLFCENQSYTDGLARPD